MNVNKDFSMKKSFFGLLDVHSLPFPEENREVVGLEDGNVIADVLTDAVTSPLVL